MRATEIDRREDSLEGEAVALILREVGARISTVAWLHRFLSQEPEAIGADINDHLYEICESMIAALADPARVTLVKAGCGDCVVGVREVIPVCLIVTEVVTNSLKYAHPTGVPGKLVVGCYKGADGSLIVEVADDGVGLPEEFDLLADGGMGARTIRVLARQLDAKVTFDSRPIGLLFRLVLPPGPRAA